MAYEKGTASDVDDLIGKLFTFATANGWTQDDLDLPNGEASMHNTGGRCFVSFRWNSTTPNNIAIYNALGFGIGVSVATVNAAGTGYTVGDTLTVAGGTSTAAATIEVLTITGGGGTGPIGTVRVSSCGINYTVNPSLTANAVTGGTGSSATMDLVMGGTDTIPGNGCDDSGQGIVGDTESAGLERSRAIPETADGACTYWFFSDSSPDYIHVVMSFSTGIYRHMNIGVCDKKGDWYGGEFACGQAQLNGVATATNNAVSFDGGWFNTSSTGSNQHTENRGPTIHMEGVIDQVAAGKWGAVFNSDATTAGHVPGAGGLLDREGNIRQLLAGGFKRNLLAPSLGWIASNASNGFVPMYAIAFYYWDKVAVPDQVALLGFMPDCKGVNIKGFSPEEEVVVGAETWVVFPVSRKANNAATDDSLNMGLAYKKVV